VVSHIEHRPLLFHSFKVNHGYVPTSRSLHLPESSAQKWKIVSVALERLISMDSERPRAVWRWS